MTATESSAGHPQSFLRRHRRKLLLAGALACVMVAVYFYVAIRAERRLQAAIAKADLLDPGWRLEEIEAKRQVIPDAENSALCVLAAKRLMPASWNGSTVDDIPANLERERQLNEQQIAFLRSEMKQIPSALAEARKLADLPHGRYAVAWSADGISTLLPHASDARRIAYLLADDVLLLAQDNKADEAVQSCRAILNTGRSFGDEPTFMSVCARLEGRERCIGSLERALAQGEPSPTAMRSLQHLLEDEQGCPLFLICARGERACGDRFIQAYQAGSADLSAAMDLPAFIAPPPGSFRERVRDTKFKFEIGSISNNRAAYLEYMTEIVEIAKLPEIEQQSRLTQLEATERGQPPLALLLIPAASSIVAQGIQKTRVRLRSAAAALAAERFRREHGHWPDTLEAMVPSFLARVPVDSYDDHALRLRRLPDGLVIYSVGPDGKDNGGDVIPDSNGLSKDIGFRLWDVAHRRQPAQLQEKY
jgi:type II secretory pathway pseudopilin PulG